MAPLNFEKADRVFLKHQDQRRFEMIMVECLDQGLASNELLSRINSAIEKMEVDKLVSEVVAGVKVTFSAHLQRSCSYSLTYLQDFGLRHVN